jgi:predicted small secreted protein
MKKTATLVCALMLAAGAQAACYTVLGPKGDIISQTSTPPVDMSYQLHQTVPYRFGPGATLVFGIADDNCGAEAEPYYDLSPTQVVHETGRRGQRAAAGQRAPRRDRE